MCIARLGCGTCGRISAQACPFTEEVVLLLTREQNLVAASLALDDPITLLTLSRANRQVHSVNQVLARAAKRRCYPLVPESLPHSGSISDLQANVPPHRAQGLFPSTDRGARNEGSRWHSAEQRRNHRHKLVLKCRLPCEQRGPIKEKETGRCFSGRLRFWRRSPTTASSP